eukprot:scaffold20215_cov64-Cylindrotheca_fusiformis.AAC.2
MEYIPKRLVIGLPTRKEWSSSIILMKGRIGVVTVERITTLCCQLTAASTAQTAKGLTIM